MKLRRLNLLTAIVSVCASGVFLYIGESLNALLWLAASVVWFMLAVAPHRSSPIEINTGTRLLRRLSRMLLWMS